MKLETTMMMVYTFVGIVAGYLSQMARVIYGETGNFVAIGIALILLVLTNEVNRRVFKVEKDFNWFFSNGGWIMLFIWFISWIVFFNPPFGTL
jgi:hypothetical protein